MAEHAILPEVSNGAVADAIRTHHRQLAAQLHERTAALLAAAPTGVTAGSRDELHRWYRTELLPHAAAEERTLYAAGADLDAARLLVRGMLAEHQALVALIGRLGGAREPLEAVAAAAAAEELFTVHLGKENDLLLPALDAAGVALSPLLEGMHEILGHPAEPEPAADGGCGCGCGHEAPASGSAADPAGPPAAADRAEVLDVRALAHGQRHSIIFGKLDALRRGESLVIVNDHDPRPLRYQTAAMWPERFSWTYQAEGPEMWRVAITRAR